MRGELVAGEADDLVPPRLFRHIERVIRHFHERLAVQDGGMRPAGDPEACGTLQRSAVEGKGMLLDRFAHALAERDGGVEHRSRK